MAHVYQCSCGHELVIHTDLHVRETYTCRKCKSIMTITKWPE